MKQHTKPLKWIYIGFKRGIVFLLLVCAVGLSSCGRRPEAIPEDVMRDIMRDALISQAILTNAGHNNGLSPRDSLDLHTRIIERYDYTMEDFRFTIRGMSMRKSNPLDNILSGVAANMKIASTIAEIRYKRHLSADSLARARTSDTVFVSDTILHGKIDGYKITYTGSVPEDSVVPPGSYRIIFDYSTGTHANAYTKSIRTKLTKEDGAITKNTIWLPVEKDTIHYTEDIEVSEGSKQLEISLTETKRRNATPDTCYLTGIRLIYLRPIKQARELFLQQITGIEPLIERYERYYFDRFQKLSGTFCPYSARHATPQRDSTFR